MHEQLILFVLLEYSESKDSRSTNKTALMKLCCLRQLIDEALPSKLADWGALFHSIMQVQYFHSQTNERVGSGNEITGIDSSTICSEHMSPYKLSLPYLSC